MHALSLLDLGFFIAETEASPKHVAGLLILKRPPNPRAAFAKDLYREFLTFTDVKPPFNRVIHFSLTALPKWRDADAVDLAQHVFFHTLPPGATAGRTCSTTSPRCTCRCSTAAARCGNCMSSMA